MVRRLLDQNARREQRRQSLLLDRIAGQFEQSLESEIASAMRSMVASWRLTREVITPRDFRSQLEATYSQMVRSTIVSFGMRIWQQGKAAGIVLEQKQDFSEFMTEQALRYLAREVIRERITGVETATRQNIIRSIARAFVDGLGEEETAKFILSVIPDIAKSRARTIARTETHGAANYGANEAAKKNDLPMKREWLSAQDPRTRSTEDGDEFDHAGANGQIVGAEEPFLIEKLSGGTEALMYPGDPSGSAGNVINCRCALGFVVDLDAIVNE